MKTSNGIILKPIPLCDNGHYMAGEDGRIYSDRSTHGIGPKPTVDWYPLKLHTNRKGYYRVTFYNKHGRLIRSAARLICMAFHGMPTPPLTQVRHLDGTTDNDRPSNLKWGTQADQWEDARLHGTSHEGERHRLSKFTNEERVHICWAIKMGLCSQHRAAAVLGVSKATIQTTVKGSSRWLALMDE